jgi:hypothetical protein
MKRSRRDRAIDPRNTTMNLLVARIFVTGQASPGDRRK